MRHYIRDKSGLCYAFTLCLANRQHSHLTDYVDEFRHTYRLTKARYPFTLHALVLLPDHLHILLTLEQHTNYSRLIAHLKSQFSRQLPKYEVVNASRHAKGERGIWQRRFWEHKIRNQTDFNNHLDYIHYNPVKHGYVQRVVDWQYSSFHHWVAQGYYFNDWGSNIDLSPSLHPAPPYTAGISIVRSFPDIRAMAGFQFKLPINATLAKTSHISMITLQL